MSERAEGMLSAAPDTVDSPCQYQDRDGRPTRMHAWGLTDTAEGPQYDQVYLVVNEARPEGEDDQCE